MRSGSIPAAPKQPRLAPAERSFRPVIGFAGGLQPMALIAVAFAAFRGVRPDRSDIAWLGAVLTYLVLSLAHSAWEPNVAGVLAAWLVHRGARRIAGQGADREALGAGFALATLVIAGFALLEVGALGRARAQGPMGYDHPNVLAHVLLVSSVGIVASFANGTVRSAGLGAAVLALVLTGSRSGLLGLAVTAALLVATQRRPRLALALMATAAIIVASVAILAVGSPWAQRIVGPLTGPLSDPRAVNLLVASEGISNTAAWAHAGVAGLATSARRGPVPAVHRIERNRSIDWARPQQLVELDPGGTYTMAAEFRDAGDGEPGFLGWAEHPDGSVEIRVSLAPDAARVRRVAGFIDVNARAILLEDGWSRLEATVTLDRSSPVDLAFGPSPDLASSTPGASTEIRALQFEAGASASTYVPTTRIRVGAGEALARLTIWRTAFDGIRARPWMGWGYGAFPEYVVNHGDDRASTPLPTHPHNQILSTAFDGGLVGLLGLGFLVTALLWRSRGWGRASLLGLLFANLFDSTLLIAAVLLPAAFLSGATSIPNAGRGPQGRPRPGRGS